MFRPRDATGAATREGKSLRPASHVQDVDGPWGPWPVLPQLSAQSARFFETPSENVIFPLQIGFGMKKSSV